MIINHHKQAKQPQRKTLKDNDKEIS